MPGSHSGRQVHQRLDVDVDHPELAVRVAWTSPTVVKPALFTSTATSSSRRATQPRQVATVGRVAEVAGGELGPHAVVALDLGGQLAQPVLAPRDQEDAVPASGQLAGELRRRCRRRAGDHAGRGRAGRQGSPSSGAYPAAGRPVIQWVAWKAPTPSAACSATPTTSSAGWASSPSRCRARSASHGRTTRSSSPST